ncbi:hypothetical protein [Bosea sp. (in: a-proteobacteria)]|uniref:hypothetical protein n=1 Tax=Bosea sp. (in: a-proteobacteria) TaxID=1871050 RepID=UPI002FC91E79
MLRTHKISIEQGSGEKLVWATLKLTDRAETAGKAASGRWVHWEDSTDEARIKFTSDSKEHLYWEWKAEAPATMLIGSKMARASHKAGEEEFFQVLITLNQVQRNSEGRFSGSGKEGAGSGKGLLTYNVSPYFEKGAIVWTVVAY